MDSPGFVISLGPMLLALVLGSLLFLAVNRGGYAWTLLIAACVGGFGSVFAGISNWENTAGAILIIGGLALLLGGAVAIRLFWPEKPPSD